MTLNYVTLTLDLYDGAGNAINAGTASFTPTVQLTDTTDHELVIEAPVTASFHASGSPAVKLLATDNGAPLPAGWAWTVTFTGVPGNPAAFNFFLPFASGAAQYLSSQAPVGQAVAMSQFLPLPSGTPAAGQVPVATGTGEASAWGYATADWINVITRYGADPAGAADSTTAIQNALSAVPAAGGTVYFPAGTYKLSSALTVAAGTTLQGTGQASVLNQTSTTAAALSCVDAVGVQVRDLTIEGPSSGSGTGISLTLSSRSNCYQVEMTDVLVKNFGSHGIAAATLIVSSLRRVVSQGNGGDGFHLTGGGTSVSFDACYANANTANGFSLNAQNYSALNGCAADSNGGNGYLLTSCSQVALTGCGAEATTSQSFKVTGGFGTSLISCYCTRNSTIAVWITGGAVAAFVQGFRESSVTGSPTASIQVDGSSTALIGICNVTTATSFANGTTTIINNNTMQTPGSTGSSSFIINRLATTNIAALNLQTGSVSQWNVEMVNNSTNDLLIRDAANGNVAATFEQHSAGENIQLLTGTKSFGGGIGVVGVANAATTPASTPSGGGVLYVSGGALHWKGSSGTDTTIAPA